jgi:hypothetical protein
MYCNFSKDYVFPCAELSYFLTKKWEGGEWISTGRIV